MNYTTVDLVNHTDNNRLLDNFKKFVEQNCAQDPLYDNYINITIDDFICLTAVIEDGEIVALSGAQYKPERWGQELVRMSTRFWMHPKYRINSLSKFQPKLRFYFNSQLMIPYQLKFLKTQPYKFAMITREGHYQKSFQKFLDLVNFHNSTSFNLLPGRFNVCKPMNHVPESCQQLVAVHSLYNHDFKEELEKLQNQNQLSLVSR